MALPVILGSLLGSGGGAAAGATAGGVAASGMEIVGAVQMIKGSLGNAVPHISANAQKFVKAITFLPNEILKVAGMIQHVAQTWGAALHAPIDTLSVIGQQLTRTVSRVNPAVVKQFQIALEDAEGVIGRQLLPVLVKWTEATRAFGDYLVKIEPITKRLATAAGQMLDSGIRLAKVLGDELIPVIDLVVSGVEVLAGNLKMLGAGITAVITVVRRFVPSGLAVLGFGKDAKEGSSAGASIRSVRFMGSEEIHQEVSRQSLIASMGGKNLDDLAKQAMVETPDWLRKIFLFMTGQLNAEELAKAMIKANTNAPGGGAAGAANDNIFARMLQPLMTAARAHAMSQQTMASQAFF